MFAPVLYYTVALDVKNREAREFHPPSVFSPSFPEGTISIIFFFYSGKGLVDRVLKFVEET